MRKILKQSILLLVIAAMGLSLAGCGPAGDAKKAEPVEEFKFVTTYTTVKGVPFSHSLCDFYTPEGLYTAYYEMHGGDMTSYPFYIAYDGTVNDFPAFTYGDFPTDSEGKYLRQLSQRIVAINPMHDGSIFLLDVLEESWNTDPMATRENREDFTETVRTGGAVLGRILASDGHEISSFPVDLLSSDVYMATALVMEDDSILIACREELLCYSPAGELQWQAQVPESVYSFLKEKDGSISFISLESNGITLYPLDLNTHRSGAPVDLPGIFSTITPGNGEYRFCYSSGSNYCGVSAASGKSEKIFSWQDLDITISMRNQTYVTEDGAFIGYLNDGMTGDDTEADFKFVRVEKVPAANAQAKTEITFATLGLSDEASNEIIRFNRASDEYRVVIKDYSQFGSNGDLYAGMLKLQTEILSGKGPDIIDLNKMAVDRLSSKGLLEDLYPYMDADPEINREDFLPNILAAAEFDGKLISTVSDFSIQTLAGATTAVGEEVGWTYDEFREALSRMPEGCAPLDPAVTRWDVLEACLMLDLENYVDWTTGACNFERKEFTDLLEFAKDYPDSAEEAEAASSAKGSGNKNQKDDDNKNGGEEDTPYSRIAEGRQMLIPVAVNDFSTSWVSSLYFGDQPVTYVGYPTLSGESGNYISLKAGYAISSSCKNKEAAWQFLRSFFMEAYQRRGYFIPANRAAFDYKLKAAMTYQYEEDDNGDFRLDENGEKIPRPIIQLNYAGHDIIYYALTPETAEKLVSLIENTTRVMKVDISILDIVEKQANAFFHGQKSAEEVARLIQAQVNIYVNEQR